MAFVMVVIQAGVYVPDSDRNTHTLHNDLQVETDGSYRYKYETSNGIVGQQSGLGGVAIKEDPVGYHPREHRLVLDMWPMRKDIIQSVIISQKCLIIY